jgi:hypothetical protein
LGIPTVDSDKTITIELNVDEDLSKVSSWAKGGTSTRRKGRGGEGKGEKGEKGEKREKGEGREGRRERRERMERKEKGKDRNGLCTIVAIRTTYLRTAVRYGYGRH